MAQHDLLKADGRYYMASIGWLAMLLDFVIMKIRRAAWRRGRASPRYKEMILPLLGFSLPSNAGSAAGHR